MEIPVQRRKRRFKIGAHLLFWLILFVLIDYNRELEVTLLAFTYFGYLFFLAIRWSFRQTKLLIQLKKEQKETELQHLKSQVNPHFFFNMLNNIYGTIDKDTVKAKQLVLKLSDMMRYSIYDGQRDFVSLEDEVEYLKNYIELHQMRYHKDIAVSYTIDIDEEGYQVMPLLFIILLENAFKHGVENLRENAFVELSLKASESEIHFAVFNNFDETTIAEQNGIGLNNLKRRLALVYPDKHQLIATVDGDIYEAQLSIYH